MESHPRTMRSFSGNFSCKNLSSSAVRLGKRPLGSLPLTNVAPNQLDNEREREIISFALFSSESLGDGDGWTSMMTRFVVACSAHESRGAYVENVEKSRSSNDDDDDDDASMVAPWSECTSSVPCVWYRGGLPIHMLAV